MSVSSGVHKTEGLVDGGGGRTERRQSKVKRRITSDEGPPTTPPPLPISKIKRVRDSLLYLNHGGYWVQEIIPPPFFPFSPRSGEEVSEGRWERGNLRNRRNRQEGSQIETRKNDVKEKPSRSVRVSHHRDLPSSFLTGEEILLSVDKKCGKLTSRRDKRKERDLDSQSPGKRRRKVGGCDSTT